MLHVGVGTNCCSPVAAVFLLLPPPPSPPTFLHPKDLDESELLLWALQCIVDLASAMASLVDDEFGTADTTLVVPRWVGSPSPFCFAFDFLRFFLLFVLFLFWNTSWPALGAQRCEFVFRCGWGAPLNEEAQAEAPSYVTVTYFIMLCRGELCLQKRLGSALPCLMCCNSASIWLAAEESDLPPDMSSNEKKRDHL